MIKSTGACGKSTSEWIRHPSVIWASFLGLDSDWVLCSQRSSGKHIKENIKALKHNTCVKRSLAAPTLFKCVIIIASSQKETLLLFKNPKKGDETRRQQRINQGQQWWRWWSLFLITLYPVNTNMFCYTKAESDTTANQLTGKYSPFSRLSKDKLTFKWTLNLNPVGSSCCRETWLLRASPSLSFPSSSMLNYCVIRRAAQRRARANRARGRRRCLQTPTAGSWERSVVPNKSRCGQDGGGLLLQHTSPSEGLNRPSEEDPVSSDALRPSMKSHRSNLTFNGWKGQSCSWCSQQRGLSVYRSSLTFASCFFTSTLTLAGCFSIFKRLHILFNAKRLKLQKCWRE